MHVVIIGGGVGGLCLAQGLKRSGVSVAVYERDASPHIRDQGWRISLKEAGSGALRDCLPAALFDLCVATAIRPATRMAFTDHRLTPKFAKPIPPQPGDVFFGVNRLTLREILLTGLDDVRHFDRTFVSYDHTGDGRVRAHFADGTTAIADLLVGADGTGSAVRHSLVPGAVIDGIGGFVYGRTPITPDLLDTVPEVLVDSFNRVTAPGGAAMSVATCRARLSPSTAAAAHAPQARLTDIPDYFAWTVSGGEGWPPAGGGSPHDRSHHGGSRGGDFRDMDASALHRLALDTIGGFHPSARRIVEHADVPATFPVRLRSARPVPRWETTNVTLLGDAIHTMSPGRGEGANVALRDAALLRRAITEAAAGAPLDETIRGYETEMLRYGFAAVEASLTQPFAPPRRTFTPPVS
ncbi:FAD-dependent oxidoreductase [Microtetraspora glauca]|uniref:FAD-dependent monooxygenase n=1 Tax=Microtetraspora glauca TaxID=1996 RepID=A0ABV3GE64_MICGL